MNSTLVRFLSSINDILWILVTIIIAIVGIYLTFKFRGIQFKFKYMIKELFAKDTNNIGLSPFRTLMLSLAGRIGVGSISGVTLAIYLAGPGTIFWIWFISILSAPIAYAETYLGIKYRKKANNGVFKGGPAYYISNGLKKKKLAVLYAIIIIICYVVGFTSIQSNTITKVVTSTLKINPSMVGVILSVVTFIIILGGIKKIADVTSKIVPVMSVIYISLALYILIINIQCIPYIFNLIIKSAFNFKSFIAGFLATMLMGVQRGIFSNEAGIGTGSIAAINGDSNDPQAQGYVQMLGIFITSFLICTATGIIVLTSNYDIINITDANGIEIAMTAFKYHLGNIGNVILTISILLFAFSTILSGYYYGESSIKYLYDDGNTKYIMILKVVVAIIIFLGSIFSPTVIWKFTDLNVSLLAFINIYAICKLKKEIN